jgi:glutathione S-transferase
MAQASHAPVLWHLRVSHYNEKARWALDYKGVAHVRREPPPGIHTLFAFAMTRRSSRFPILRIEGRTIFDSTRIIEELERRVPDPALYPAAPAERERALRLEDELDESLAPDVRRFIFHHLFGDPERVVRAFTLDEPGFKQQFLRASGPVLQPIMSRRYQVSAERAQSAEANIFAHLDRIAAELDGSDYLVGDRFTVADLTAAALLSPLLKPAEVPYPGPPFVGELAAVRERALAHPAGAWALSTYARHRGSSAEVLSRERSSANRARS